MTSRAGGLFGQAMPERGRWFTQIVGLIVGLGGVVTLNPLLYIDPTRGSCNFQYQSGL